MEQPQPPIVKPRMRGWLHLWSFGVSVLACATLIAVAAAVVGPGAALATSVYSLTIMALFGVSALYHRHRWTTVRSRMIMKRLDHSMIFLFIAGTYTAVCALAMEPSTARWVLIVVWAGALAGVALKLIWPSAPSWLAVPIYVALGWVAVFVFPEMLQRGGVAAFVLILAGGALYTAGAVFYATKRPDPWPTTFGYHEFFHAATVLAAACHYVAIWLVLFAG